MLAHVLDEKDTIIGLIQMSIWSNWDSEMVAFLKKYEKDIKFKKMFLIHGKSIQAKDST